MATTGPETALARSSPQLASLSMAQVSVQLWGCVLFPKLRVPMYVAPKTDFVSVADYVVELGLTSLAVDPGFVLGLMKENYLRKRLKKLETLGELALIGSPVSEDTCKDFLAMWTKEVGTPMRIKTGYGMTE